VSSVTDPVTEGPAAHALGVPGELIEPDEIEPEIEPDPSTFYKHKIQLRPSIVALWERRDMIYTLAERDIRSNYKQAALGFGWALISPVISLVIFTVIFGHVKGFKTPGIPYPIFLYTGIIIWGYFTGALSSGSTAIISNISLMQKTHFPRECFPLSQMLEQVVYTSIAWVPLAILMAIHEFPPHWQLVFFPILALEEVIFTAGVILVFGSAIIYIRDLTNLMGLLIQFGLFATPIIWPFDKIPVSWNGLPLRGIYSFFNPIGPIIDSFRNILLLGKMPDWNYLGIGMVSSVLVFLVGYRTFKYLEVNFADIA
jgi:ABC-type polysaccharide/polyol phosphate export permease